MAEAFFVKDVIGPKGCVSIVATTAGAADQSANVDAHTQTEALKLHHAMRKPDGTFAKADDMMSVTDEPNHDELCRREQERRTEGRPCPRMCQRPCQTRFMSLRHL